MNQQSNNINSQLGKSEKQEQDQSQQQHKEQEYYRLAKKHYFAYQKIKDGQHRHAEIIYRRIIKELMSGEEGECDHAKLAVTTLLLALHLQRMGQYDQTRAVFLNFFRQVAPKDKDGDAAAARKTMECACSAKVLGAYAVFEMKQGNTNKSLQIALRAVQFDQELRPVLQWKPFRTALEEKAKRQERQRRRREDNERNMGSMETSATANT